MLFREIGAVPPASDSEDVYKRQAYGPAGYSFEVLETLTPQEGQTPKEFREDLNQLLALWRQRENEA